MQMCTSIGSVDVKVCSASALQTLCDLFAQLKLPSSPNTLFATRDILNYLSLKDQ